MKKGFVSVLAFAAVTAAFWPAAGGASTFKGIVVAKQHGALLVASPAGALQLVHARAAVGSRLALTANGAAVVGRATHATIRGIVVRRIGTTLILSSNHHLIAIPNRVGRRLSDNAPPATATTAPAPGAVVTTDVSIQNGQLEDDGENEVGQVNSSSISVQATIKAIAAGSVTLDVQGQSVTVPLPAGLTLPASLVGQTVTINLSLGNGSNDQGDDDQGDNNDQGDSNQGGGGGGGDD
jgi:hypothetical protein